MKNLYCEFGNGTIVTYNNIGRDENGEHIRMYFEQAYDDGFKFLETILPDLNVVDSDGFDELEIKDMISFAKDNAAIIWEDARDISRKKAV